MASAKIIDMTNVKEGGRSFNKKRVPEGDYLARVTKVEDTEVKSGDNKGDFQWLFSISLEKSTGIYPYYCKLQENQLWKVRNLLIAAGINVPKKKLKLDPERLVGKLIAVSMEDDEYDGKLQSTIAAIFPVAEMNGGSDDDASVDDDDDEDEDEDDTEPEPEPEPVKKKRKKASEPEPEEEEEEEEEEDEEEEPAPVVKKKKKRQVTEDELEELDIDDV